MPRALPPLAAALVVLLPLTAPPAAAQPRPAATGEEPEPPAGEPVAPAWSGSVGLSYLDTGGNAETTTLGADLELARAPEPWGIDLVASFHRTEEGSAVTAERYLARVRGKRALAERWSLYAGLSGEKDEFADVDLRLLAEAGVEHVLLTGPRHLMDLHLGLTWTDEDRLPPAPDVDFLGAVVDGAYDWEIGEGSVFSQRVAWYPNFDRSDDWRAESVTALTTTINARLAVKLSYELRHRNRPIGDNEETDTVAKASLVWKL